MICIIFPELSRLNRSRFVPTKVLDINTNHLTFSAKSVVVAPIGDGIHLVGFSGCEENYRNYLVLQRACVFDEQDVAFGMDTYHVEWCGQEKSTYGGVSRFTLRPGSADIEFFPDASRALGGLERVRITFQLAFLEERALLRALECIFEGDDCLVTDSDKSS